MPKFRKKPVVIEAMLVPPVGSAGAIAVLADWLRQNQGERPCRFTNSYCKNYYTVEIPTLEGDMVANVGDWIIKGIAGELYPCKDHIFKETYEKVE